ncbi:cupredoxin domain-containing protein [Silvibacterium dinghuense]|uniref:Cytochrome c oxidase subunit II n=1 Tax=Silvibacterium dinghuense TaxID=1560006 RepID=A0A4Q1SFU9_9BACT|nr:cupredoxin domain-containing protein [Silvibacterium dinghuense]RXS96451.1 cytochrome c oxidase subunit II [Silvibacterium dinghuense]
MNRNAVKAFSAVVLAAAFAFTPFLRAEPRTIEVHAKRYAFVPDQLTLKKGEPVTLVMYSDDVAHSLKIDGLGVNIKAMGSEKAEQTITPGQTGDFTGKCGVFCGSGHGKMLLTVHVVDK